MTVSEIDNKFLFELTKFPEKRDPVRFDRLVDSNNPNRPSCRAAHGASRIKVFYCLDSFVVCMISSRVRV